MSARDARALEGLDEWDVYGAPEPGFTEQCYFFKLHADDAGETVVGLLNDAEDLGASLRFSTNELPAFTLWKNTAAERDGYVTGLEPGSDYPNPRSFEREQGRVVELAPGEVREIDLQVELHRDAGEVAALEEEVEALMKGKECTICEDLDPELTPTE
jgi:hypothetical protein